MGPILVLSFSLDLFLIGVIIWFVVRPTNMKLGKCSLVWSITSMAVENIDML